MEKQVKKMSDFKENKLKNLDKVVGGLADPIRIATITGVLDGVRHNTDFCIGRCD